jgi:hypothetical protein
MGKKVWSYTLYTLVGLSVYDIAQSTIRSLDKRECTQVPGLQNSERLDIFVAASFARDISTNGKTGKTYLRTISACLAVNRISRGAPQHYAQRLCTDHT